MAVKTGTSWQIDGDGTLVSYPDPFKNVDQTSIDKAISQEDKIITTKIEIESNFLKLAYLLDEFDNDGLYLARGYENLRSWSESPDIELSWRVVQDLLRIKREVIPLLSEQYNDSQTVNKMILEAGISKVRTALPLLRDADHSADFIDVIEAAPSMPWNDVRKEVKERRGLARDLNEKFPVLFRGDVKIFDEHANIKFYAIDGSTSELLGTLRIRREWLARFEDRFGSFISFDRA